MEPDSASLEKWESMTEFIKFTEYLDPELWTIVTQLLKQSISRIPVDPVEFDGKRLSPLALAVNVLPPNVRIDVMENLKRRVGEEGAPTRSELDELQQLLDMHADPTMSKFDSFSLSRKLKLWRAVKRSRERGIADDHVLQCVIHRLTEEDKGGVITGK